jgi:hypothetical protein
MERHRGNDTADQGGYVIHLQNRFHLEVIAIRNTVNGKREIRYCEIQRNAYYLKSTKY